MKCRKGQDSLWQGSQKESLLFLKYSGRLDISEETDRR